MWSLLKLSRVTYSPNTVTNKKPALGGLETAQVLRRLSDAQNDTSNLVSNQAAGPRV